LAATPAQFGVFSRAGIGVGRTKRRAEKWVVADHRVDCAPAAAGLTV